jgi:hypothetical protein
MDAGDGSRFQRIVMQAAEMVSFQADCRIEQAISMMWNRAHGAGVSIEDIATAVLDHSIRFG